MAKTLKDFVEGYLKVKSADEQKFIDKHATAKVADRNGNGDDVFNGNTKTIDRRKDRKGYNPGEDEKVYEGLSESTYEFDVSGEDGKAGVDKFVKHANSKGIKAKVHTYDGPAGGNPIVHLTHKDPKALHSYVNTHMYPVHDISKHKINEALTGSQHKIDANKNGKVDAHDFKLLRGKKKKVAEEADQIDELSEPTVRTYYNKAGEQGKKIADKMKMVGGDFSSDGSDTKTLKKRAAGRAMALKRRSGEMKMSEDVINEKDAPHIKDYGAYGDSPSGKKSNVYGGRASSAKEKMIADFNKPKNKNEKPNRYTKEEAIEEKLDMKKASMGTVVKDFKTANAPQFKGKSESKRRVMAIAAKLSAERGGKPLNKEERLLTKLADISETHQRTMISIFEKLNEDNKSKFLNACNTPEGVENMLDFAINNRGE